MGTFKGTNGTEFKYSDGITDEPIVIVQTNDNDAVKATPVDANDLLEFADDIFQKAHYESVARMRIKKGDVVIVRTQPNMSSDALNHIEKAVTKQLLEPLGYTTDDVAVVVLDGSLDIELAERDQ